MSDKAELHSLEALENYATFWQISRARLQDQLRSKLKRLANFDSQAGHNVDIAQSERAAAANAYLNCDEEDNPEYYRRKLDEAEYTLVNALEKRQQVQQIIEQTKSRIESKLDVINSRMRTGSNKLHLKIQSIKDYLSIRADSSAVDVIRSPGVAPSSMAGLNEAAPKTHYDADTIKSTPLPKGFEWMDINLIRLDLETENIEFSKVPREDMRKGLKVLVESLLPTLRQHPNISYMQLIDMDRERNTLHQDGGLVHEQSLSNCYSWFLRGLSAEPIRLEQSKENEFSVTNGRHRILVAKELGIPFLPVSVGRRKDGS